MILHRRLMICAMATAMAGGTTLPAQASPWVRGFVVGTYEYAFRYGGRPDYSRGAEIEPGIDCPHGASVHFANDTQTKIAVARQKGRSQQEIDWISKPPGLDDVRAPVLTRFHIWNRAVAYRAYKRGIETYVNPWAADDPGEPQVTSRIGDGFNLDGKIKPTDFVSPDGEKGIDNNLYRAWGCDAPWRGNGNATLDMRANDKMQDGLYTMVIRVSGNQDPMNDSDATVEIGYSPDKIVKDARGSVSVDYSYRILQAAQYTKMKATIKNGVVESEQVEHLHSPRIAWFYDQTGDMNFTKGKIRSCNIAPDGHIRHRSSTGGYRNYVNSIRNIPSPRMPVVNRVSALRRSCRALLCPAPQRRRYAGTPQPVNTRQHLVRLLHQLASAYVVDPDKPMDIPKLALDEERMQAAFWRSRPIPSRASENTRAPACAAGNDRSRGRGF